MRLNGLSLAAAALLAAPAAAAEPAPRPVQVEQLMNCRNQADAGQRLRCYDDAAARLSSAIAAGDVVALDRQAINRQRRDLFGFSLPRIGILSGNDDSPEQRQIETRIQRVSQLGNGKWRLVLDDGAHWETTETLSSQEPPRSGQSITIKRGLIGGFMASIDGAPLRRVKRVQ